MIAIPKLTETGRLWLIALLVILLSVLLALFGITNVLAQGNDPRTPTDDEVNAVAKGLYCPVCENIPLDVCPTQACSQWRELIREKLAQGWSDGQIKQYFVDQYGDRVLATPPARGLNWLIYVIPPVAILAGAYILFRAMKAWRGTVPQPAPTDASPQTLSDNYVARLEEELRKR